MVGPVNSNMNFSFDQLPPNSDFFHSKGFLSNECKAITNQVHHDEERFQKAQNEIKEAINGQS